MASITGGNLLVVMATMVGIMFLGLIFMFIAVFSGNGDILSIRMPVKEDLVVEDVNNQITKTESLDPETSRQLLNFVEYPVVHIPDNVISVFAPESATVQSGLSEVEI